MIDIVSEVRREEIVKRFTKQHGHMKLNVPRKFPQISNVHLSVARHTEI